MPKKSQDRLLSDAELRERFGIEHTVSTRRRLELQGQFPKKIRISPQRFVYRQSEIIEWMDKRSRERRTPAPGLRPLVKGEQSVVLGEWAVQALEIINVYINAAKCVAAPEVNFPDGARLVSLPRFPNWVMLSLPSRDGMDVFCVHDGRWTPYDGPRPLAGHDVLAERETLVTLLKSGLAGGPGAKNAALKTAMALANALANRTYETTITGEWWRVPPAFDPDTDETTIVYTRFDLAAVKPRKEKSDEH